MLRVLALTKYGSRAASARLRFLQYVEPLRKLGFEVTLSPLLGDDYLEGRMAGGRRSPTAALRGLASRLLQAVEQTKWDVLWIQYELVPYLPAGIESLMLSAGRGFVLDLDDAIFHIYDQHPSRFVRALLGGKIASLARRASAVTAGSPYLEDYARKHCDNVFSVPTVIDPSHYLSPVNLDQKVFRIGWIGSPSTTKYLESIRGPLKEVSLQIHSELRTIGAKMVSLPGVNVCNFPWSLDTEARLLSECTVGVMPLTDDHWARGKCAFKLIQYMATGLPVVASPVGMNHHVVADDCGFLAESHEDWVAALVELATNSALRTRMGASGKARVAAHYTVDAVVASVARALGLAARP